MLDQTNTVKHFIIEAPHLTMCVQGEEEKQQYQLMIASLVVECMVLCGQDHMRILKTACRPEGNDYKLDSCC